jgi:hypothetical protein
MMTEADPSSESDQRRSAPEVILRKAGDPPFAIDPQAILSAFVVLTLADVRQVDNASGAVAKLNRYCQPQVWRVSFKAKFGAFACSAAPGGFPDVRAVAPALERMGIQHPFSLVINTMTVSLDGGASQVKVLAGFAFREHKVRILFPGNDGCVPA